MLEQWCPRLFSGIVLGLFVVGVVTINPATILFSSLSAIMLVLLDKIIKEK